MKRQARFAFLGALAAALHLAGALQAVATDYPVLDPNHPVVGTLQSEPAHIPAMTATGAAAVVVGIIWERCEPREGEFDAAYLKSVEEKIDAFRAARRLVVLDLGVQYPPKWIFRYASSHFVDQYGHAFEPVAGEGECGVNLVFSEEMRSKFASYLDGLFIRIGTDFYAIRLGGGRYGELGYPASEFGSDHNCYWAFDEIAQGKTTGLPPGLTPCPVPGWKPGASSPDHASARSFLEWYMESMRNYHDWQIAVTRRHFAGALCMLYPSTGGLRPRQLEAAVQDDCDGSTGPEKTGEVGRGYDMPRFIAGITDTKVIVYSTWIDGFPFCDDASTDPARWNPAHYLAGLAAAHHPPLPCGGENTGHPDDLADMELTFQRMREEHLCVVFWAFEPTLFQGKKGLATVADLKKCLASGIEDSSTATHRQQ